MLSKFIVCRERFRMYSVYGYKAEDDFDHKIEFGNYWHHAKETWRAGEDWKAAVQKHKHYLMSCYPAKADEIEKWAYIASGVFKVWLSSPRKLKSERQILQEVAFKVPYTLPSGRKVYMRGKYDSIYAQGKNLYIEDDKSKGFIDDEGISATLDGVLQMGFYHTAARVSLIPGTATVPTVLNCTPDQTIQLPKSKTPYKFAGTRYNIVRRPLAEKNPIRPRKAETAKQFYDRAIQQVKGNPDYYFIPKTLELPESKLKRFQQRILHPWLESLCDWWTWIKVNPDDPWSPQSSTDYLLACSPDDPEQQEIARKLGNTMDKISDSPLHNSIHYQTPWGVFNSLFGGFRGDYFTLLTRGSDNGLKKVSTLFPELQED
jgi:hypothetical protein